MTKPIYKSKKFWIAVVTVLSLVATFVLTLWYPSINADKVSQLIAAVGTALILGFGLEDMGKASKQ